MPRKPVRYRVVLQSLAVSDLAAIRAHVARDSPESADDLVEWLLAALGGLELFPARFAVVEESVVYGIEVRAIVIGSYKILYTIERETVRVLRFWHAARLPPEGLFDA